MPASQLVPGLAQPGSGMTLTILIPSAIFATVGGVERIVADTIDGSYGFLLHRRDCIAVLSPGILCYATAAQGEVFVAVDAGALVKSGAEVLVSVRRAVGGVDLEQLQAVVAEEFQTIDAEERSLRSVMAKLETGFVTRFASFQHE